MAEEEFDKFAEEYEMMLRESIQISGEGPEYFAHYKIQDMALLLETKLPTARPMQILDFGGGVGGSLPFLSRYFPSANITLADISQKSLEYAARRKIPRVNTLHFDGRKLPIQDHHIDTAIAACVFHHIPETEHVELMSEIRRVMRPGGLFFVFEHNPWNPLTQKIVKNCPFDESAVLISGPDMRLRMQKAGFNDVCLAWRVFFPAKLRSIRRLERHLEWLPLGAQYRAVGTA